MRLRQTALSVSCAHPREDILLLHIKKPASRYSIGTGYQLDIFFAFPLFATDLIMISVNNTFGCIFTDFLSSSIFLWRHCFPT